LTTLVHKNIRTKSRKIDPSTLTADVLRTASFVNLVYLHWSFSSNTRALNTNDIKT